MADPQDFLTSDQKDFITTGEREAPRKQKQALELGASEQEVASASRTSVEQVRENVSSPSLYSEEAYQEEGPSLYEPELPAMPSKEAARKSLYASLAEDGDVTADYIGMYDQFTEARTSSIFNRIESNVRGREKERINQVIHSSARQGDLEGTQQLLEAAPAILASRASVKKAGLENASDSFTESYDTPRTKEYQDKFLADLDGASDLRESLNNIISHGVAQASDLTLIGENNTLDQFTESALLGDQLFGLATVGKEILGERYNFSGGSMMRDIVQEMNTLPDKERPAFLEKVVESVIRNSGVKGNNDLISVFALETLREFVEAPGGDVPLTRWLTDIAGYADATIVIPGSLLVKTTQKLLKMRKFSTAAPKFDTVIQELSHANPDIDSALTAAAIKDPQVAEKLGTTVGESVARAMPSTHMDSDIILQGAPNSLKERIQGLKTRSEEAKEFIDNTFLYQPEDFAVKMKSVHDVLTDEKIIAEVKPSFSSLDIDPNSNAVTVRATYGDETDMPLNLEKATRMRENIAKLVESEGIPNKDVKVVTKNPTLGTYEPYDKKAHAADGEFLISLNTKADMRIGDIIEGDMFATKDRGTIIGQALGGSITDPQNYVRNTLLGAARVASDAKAGLSQNLKTLSSPFTSLNWWGQKRVASVLKAGEEFVDPVTKAEGKVFKFHELEGRLNTKEIEAYYSARLLNDTVHDIKNTSIRNRLLVDGYKGLSIDMGDGNFFKNGIKELDDTEILKQTRVVIDPISGEEIFITAEKLIHLRERGLVIGKVLRSLDKGNKSFHYVAVRADDLHDLPTEVFPKRTGYNFRINNDPYFIDNITSKIVDGVKMDRTPTVGVARSAEEANRYIDKLKLENPGEKYELRIDRNINSQETMLQNDIDAMDGSGSQFWFSERGRRLTRIDGSESSIEDPVTAINKMIASTANVATHAEFMEVSLAKHRATYGNLMTAGGQPLWYWDPLSSKYRFDKVAAKEFGNPNIARALNEYNYLELINYAPTDVDVLWRGVMEGFDKVIGKQKSLTGLGLRSKASGAVTRTLSANTPGKVLRGAAFALSIPLRPLRHAPLQALHAISLAGIDPVNMVKSFKDGGYLALSMATWQNPTAWRGTKQLAKALGHTEESWEELFTAFRKSGKPYTIDSHVAIGEANFTWSRSMAKSLPGYLGEKAVNILKSPIVIGKAVGFDTGELVNQATTYSFAFNRWKKANPGMSPIGNQRALDMIANDARNLSVDMTRTSAFNYQKGAFASTTQFMAINHKMMIKVLGQDGTLPTTRARVAYVTGLLAMYGAEGVGLGALYSTWRDGLDVEIPEELSRALEGGFTELAVNTSLDLAFGDEIGSTRLAFSKSFSPAAGVISMVPDFIENMMDLNVIEMLEGPSRSVFPNISKAVSYIGDIIGRDDLDTGDKLIKSAVAAGREFGGFSDAFKANLILSYHDKLGEKFLVDKDGRPTLIAHTWGEVLGRLAFGISAKAEGELYEDLLPMLREVQSTGRKHEGSVDKDAKHLVRYIYEAWATSKDDLDLRDKVKAITWSLHQGDMLKGKEIQNKAWALFKRDPRYVDFVANIMKTTTILDKDANIDAMVNSVRHSDLVTDEDKPKIIEHIRQLAKSAELNREILNESF